MNFSEYLKENIDKDNTSNINESVSIKSMEDLSDFIPKFKNDKGLFAQLIQDAFENSSDSQVRIVSIKDEEVIFKNAYVTQPDTNEHNTVYVYKGDASIKKEVTENIKKYLQSNRDFSKYLGITVTSVKEYNTYKDGDTTWHDYHVDGKINML